MAVGFVYNRNMPCKVLKLFIYVHSSLICITNNSHWSIRVDVTMDTAPRTIQHSELLAAVEYLKALDCTNMKSAARPT
jgi:hypothetical protein